MAGFPFTPHSFHEPTNGTCLVHNLVGHHDHRHSLLCYFFLQRPHAIYVWWGLWQGDQLILQEARTTLENETTSCGETGSGGD